MDKTYIPGGFSNEAILQQLRHGIANFEIASSPVPSVSSQCFRGPLPLAPSASVTPRFFARIGPSLGASSPAMKKVERYSVQKVTGDGRCLFRALVKGMAVNKGTALGPREERESAGPCLAYGYLQLSYVILYEMGTYDELMADELRMAVKEVICDNDKERLQYEEALVAITVDEPLRRYCQRIGRPDFWGGEAELLVLSKLCCQPIVVYIPEHEHGGRGSGFIPIQEYGSEFRKGSKKGKPREVVRLLYTGKNHYDLLV
ncbi:UNVERIFIED_CONTAM: OVARIAN TUMOR DOMAIN-containing deubiquitinating enzyme 3 [Sesamum radiatum]|uniref:Ubiquitin thioesterase OTU n=1 Tax=Sesamum radiatum TaxID=300843 RepID=A0AAW2NLY1_SESRA